MDLIPQLIQQRYNEGTIDITNVLLLVISISQDFFFHPKQD